MAIPTLDGNNVVNVESITEEKNGNILPLPIPTQDAGSTELFDLGGAVKIVSVRGTWMDTTAVIKGYKDTFEALISGDQQSTVTFSSDQTGSITCLVMSMSVTWNVPGNNAEYDIKLVLGV